MEQEREWLDEELAGLDEPASTDADWRNFGDGINGRSDATYVAEMIHETRDGARSSRRVRCAEPADPPVELTADPPVELTADPPAETTAFDSEAWDAYRRRLFEEHVGVNARFARAMFGLAGPLPPEDLPELLSKAREQERHRGDLMRLEVPVIQDGRVQVAEEWTVYRGHEADKRGEQEVPQPLGFLAGRAADLASRTGTHQVDAVLYLLSDIVVYWPPVYATVERRPRFSIVMHVEWPFIAPDSVAELYTRMQGSLYGLRDDATAAERLAVGKRVWSAELVHFAGERRERRDPPETWASIHAAWAAAYPDKAYKTPLSLRRSYLEADKRFPDMSLAPAPWRPKGRGKDGSR